MKKKILLLGLGLIMVVGFLFGALYFGVERYKAYKVSEITKEQQIQAKFESQQDALDTARQEIQSLRKQGVAVQKKQESLTSGNSISSDDLSNYLGGVMQIDCGDITGTISLWSLEYNGSGGYFGVTNSHVIRGELGDVVNFDCLLFPGTDGFLGTTKESKLMAVVSPSEAVAWNEFADVAVMPIKKVFTPQDGCTGANCNVYLSKSALNYSIGNLPACPSKMPVGSPVVVVGFPAYSAQGSASYRITTNGIISGYDILGSHGTPLPFANYFVSAKVDSGNSGGVAISKKGATLCLLGIPTWLTVGNYETGGLIQNIKNVMYESP